MWSIFPLEEYIWSPSTGLGREDKIGILLLWQHKDKFNDPKLFFFYFIIIIIIYCFSVL